MVYQLTLWSNSYSGSGWIGSKLTDWSSISQAGGPRQGETGGGRSVRRDARGCTRVGDNRMSAFRGTAAVEILKRDVRFGSGPADLCSFGKGSYPYKPVSRDKQFPRETATQFLGLNT